MTISERAKKWCKQAFGCFLKNEANCYYQGATDQRNIDVEKACEALYTIQDKLNADMMDIEKATEIMRNAMMEE